MKLLIFVIFIIFKFTTLVNANNVVYIDMSYILSNSIHGKLILDQLEVKNKKNIADLQSKENLLKDLEKKINNQKNILSKTELEKKIKDLKSKIIIFNKDKDNLSNEFNEYKNNQVADFMKKIHLEFPEYNWKKNKGYPTKEHRNAIKEFGITKYHRKTFRLVPTQLKLNV